MIHVKNATAFLLQGGIPRLLASWITVLAYAAVRHKGKIFELSLAEGLPLFGMVAVVALLYLTLTLASFLAGDRRWDKRLLGASSLAYASTLAFYAGDLYVGLGICGVLGAILWYLLARKGEERDLSPRVALPLTAGVAILFALFVGGYTAARYLTYSSPAFDFGIFSQMFHHMKERFLPLTTCERDGLLSHFAVHVSPVYYLILPVYCLFPSPVTLQIAQAVILASGVIPLYLLARRFDYSHQASFLWCCAYAFYPALSGGCSFDLHENCFLAPFLLWLFYAAETRRTGLLYLFAGLTLCVKEDAAVYVAFFALYLLFSRRNRRDGGILLGLSLLVFLTEAYLLDRFGDGVMDYRYGGYFSGDGSMLDMLVNLLKDPALLFQHLITAERLTFLLLMLVPLLGLPLLFGRKPSRLLLLGPFLLVNLMPQYEYQYSIWFQYVFGSLAFLFYASLLNVREKKAPAKRALPALCAAFALVLFFSTAWEKHTFITRYREEQDTYRIMDRYLDAIPKDVSVKASAFLLPHLSQRDEIYVLETEHDTEYVVIDLRYPDMEQAAETARALADDPGFRCLVHEEGLLAIYCRVPFGAG